MVLHNYIFINQTYPPSLHSRCNNYDQDIKNNSNVLIFEKKFTKKLTHDSNISIINNYSSVCFVIDKRKERKTAGESFNKLHENYCLSKQTI